MTIGNVNVLKMVGNVQNREGQKHNPTKRIVA